MDNKSILTKLLETLVTSASTSLRFFNVVSKTSLFS
jgi:hypothetical protein